MTEYISSPDIDTISQWVALCSRLAPFSSILMFLSPIPTIRQILRTGTVGDLPLLPYTSMVASCFVWIIYGFIKKEPRIWFTNVVEFILSVYYFVEFTNYAPKYSPTFPGSVYRHIQFCIGIWVGSLFYWIANILFYDNIDGVTATIGDLTILLSVLTFASPLAAVKAVFESQSSEAIPWPFTLAALFNCVLWSIVGIFEMHDVYVSAPAILGLLFGLLQVALKLYFGDNNNNNQDIPSYTQAPVEMPYSVLNSVRQVVMLGNNDNTIMGQGDQYNYFSTNSNLTQHGLQFDYNILLSNSSNTATNTTDYADLGIPLTN